MIIGSVIELKDSENRVGLIPEFVKVYVDNNHEVIVESGLGLASGFLDAEYIEAGASVVATAKEVWDQVEMMIKVKEPMECEYPLMREDQIIFTYFHLAANKGLTLALMHSGSSALAYETVEDENGNLVLLKPMSEIAGKLAILEGNKYLEHHFGGKGVLLSGTSTVDSGKVVVVGAGNVGKAAITEALGLNAHVTALVKDENELSALTLEFPNIEVLISTADNIISAISDADIVVSCVLIPGARTTQLIKREYLKLMEPGTVIVDVAIDQGGTLETSRPTTHSEPIYIIDDIIHYCVSNMAGAVPKTASKALNSATMKYGLQIANLGLDRALEDVGLLRGLNIYQGKLLKKEVRKVHNIDI